MISIIYIKTDIITTFHYLSRLIWKFSVELKSNDICDLQKSKNVFVKYSYFYPGSEARIYWCISSGFSNKTSVK
jgi:hypothetical protein